jgi:transcriptional regulator with XRE-family HTH domain
VTSDRRAGYERFRGRPEGGLDTFPPESIKFLFFLGVKGLVICMNSLSIGLAIRTLRKRKGVTGKELGDHVGLKHYDISRIENGKVRLDFMSATKIASALGVSLDQIREQSEKLDRKLASRNITLSEIDDAKAQLNEVLKELKSIETEVT